MPPAPRECDLVVVGAGIVGLAVAREMARRHDGLRVAVLERGPRIAGEQTGNSSGVIHAGVYYAPGSLKARLCVEGARELYSYCDARAIPAIRNGKLVVATRETELGRLDELERRARANGVSGLRRVSADEIAEIEPHATGVAALHSPATGVVDFARVAAGYAEDVEGLNGSVHTGCGVAAVDEDGGGAVVRHAGGTTRARAVAVCAGLWADRLAVAAGRPADPRIVPIRGRYLRLRPQRSHLVRANLYPAPDPALPFLGAHLTRGADDRVSLGPSATIAAQGRLTQTISWPGTWRLARHHWRSGAGELRSALWARAYVAQARRLVPELRATDFVAGFDGIRAQAVGRDGSLIDDFVISRTERAVYVRNAPSPAATASLPLARLIADDLEPLLG
jgi:2-hydroxyglutarate dehydrogenase